MTELTTQSLAAQLRAKRSEMMISELEAVALRLFEERGFDQVTVDEIASEARISVRTFYRYFPAKEDVLQVKIDRRSEALRAALAARPVDEAPLHSLRLALEEAVSRGGPVLSRRWTAVDRGDPERVEDGAGRNSTEEPAGDRGVPWFSPRLAQRRSGAHDAGRGGRRRHPGGADAMVRRGWGPGDEDLGGPRGPGTRDRFRSEDLVRPRYVKLTPAGTVGQGRSGLDAVTLVRHW